MPIDGNAIETDGVEVKCDIQKSMRYIGTILYLGALTFQLCK